MPGVAAVTRERVQGTVRLGGARRLGYVAFGRPGGRCVIWMHGTPGAATQVPEGVRARAERDGLWIIGIDRPGIGASTGHLYPDIVTFVDDLEVLLDALGVETCHVVGLSGGGPYTLAAAARLADRVRSVGVLGGVAPSVGDDAIGGGAVALARFAGPFLRVARLPLGFGLARFIRVATPVGDPAIRLYARFSPDGDRGLLNHPEFKEVFVGDLTRRGHRQFSAVLADLVLFARPWGFALSEVTVPVHWWHGTDDNLVPFADGEAMAAHLPDATVHSIVGGGHLCGFGVCDDVLDVLLGD